MRKQITTFVTASNSGTVTQVGRSTIMQPTTNFKGGSIKWFDDSKLIRKSAAANM